MGQTQKTQISMEQRGNTNKALAFHLNWIRSTVVETKLLAMSDFEHSRGPTWVPGDKLGTTYLY